jgi:hypothetical protein
MTCSLDFRQCVMDILLSGEGNWGGALRFCGAANGLWSRFMMG